MDAHEESRPAAPARSQSLLASAVACALVALAAWYLTSGGWSGGLVHHDAAPVHAGPGYTVNVNAAGEAELAQLPGLGPATARAIVDHRRAHGPFASVEALLDVPGVGPATLDEMRPHLRPIRPDGPAAALDER